MMNLIFYAKIKVKLVVLRITTIGVLRIEATTSRGPRIWALAFSTTTLSSTLIMFNPLGLF